MTVDVRRTAACRQSKLRLALTTLKYFCISHGDKRVFQFEIIINVLWLALSASFEYLEIL